MVSCLFVRSSVLVFSLAGLSARAERPSRVDLPDSQLALDAVEVRARGHLARQRAQGSESQVELGDPLKRILQRIDKVLEDVKAAGEGDGKRRRRRRRRRHKKESSSDEDGGGQPRRRREKKESSNEKEASAQPRRRWRAKESSDDKGQSGQPRRRRRVKESGNDNSSPASAPASDNSRGHDSATHDGTWKDLITGSSCPASTELTSKSGGPAGRTISCKKKPNGGRHFKFPAGKFDIDVQVVVPAGTIIEGNANPNDPSDKAKKPDASKQTFFVATHGVTNPKTAYCGTGNNMRPGQAQKLRIGFLLHSNTMVRNINFQGKDATRPLDNGSLCGGAAFETPGCVSEGFATGRGNNYVGHKGCIDRNGHGNDLVTGDGRGVENVVIDSVRLNDMLGDNLHGTQIAVWLAQTKDGSATKKVKVTNLVSMLTRGDGINFHGNVQDSVVENCHIENTGDDIFAVWGGYMNPTGIVFRNNVGKNAGVTRNFGYGVCIAVYGARDVEFTGTTCYDPKQNPRCAHGPFCNSCLAYVHDNYFGAVYPSGNTISFTDNKYLNMDGSKVSDGRPMVRSDVHKGSKAHIVQS